MSGNRILWGQITLVLAVVLATTWTATQWTAWRLGFQPQLGQPWFELAQGAPVYYPPAFFWWWYAYDAYAPSVFIEGAFIAASGGFIAAVAIAMSVWRAREAKNVETYGSARWASNEEIHSAGLARSGRCHPRLPCRALSAPRRSRTRHGVRADPLRQGRRPGRSDAAVLAGERRRPRHQGRELAAHGRLAQPVRPRPAVRSDRSAQRPLQSAARSAQGPDEVRDVQNIADILVDPEGALERRNHWEKTSPLAAGRRHPPCPLCRRTKDFGARRQLSVRSAALLRTHAEGHDGDQPSRHAAKARRASGGRVRGARGPQQIGERALRRAVHRDVVPRPLPRSDGRGDVTRRCDWRIADLVDAERPVSLYLVIPPSDISRTKPLVRLVLNQIGRCLTERLEGDPSKSRKHKLLLMLDEFPALGRLDFFETALAFMAGYGIRAYLIAQSLNQITKAYGENNSILDNCHVRIAFATNDERTAKRISDALGTATELRAQRNLCRTPAFALARPRHGFAAGDGASAPDARRGHATAACGRTGAGFRPGADPRQEGALLRRPPLPMDGAEQRAESRQAVDVDPANAGIRREPELPEQEEIVRSERPADREFDVLEDESDLDAAKARALRQSVRIVARQAAMDPADGIGL